MKSSFLMIAWHRLMKKYFGRCCDMLRMLVPSSFGGSPCCCCSPAFTVVAIVHCVTLANRPPCIKGRQRCPSIPTLSSHYQGVFNKVKSVVMVDTQNLMIRLTNQIFHLHHDFQGPEEAVGDRIVGEHKEGFCGSSAEKDKRWALLLKKHQMSDTGHVPKKILGCFGG